MEKLSQLAKLIDIIALSKASVLQALDSKFGDFEDALQHYAALSENVKTIVTRNVKDFRNSELAVLMPDQYLSSRS